MTSKFKLICLFVIGTWSVTVNAQNAEQKNHSPRLLVIGDDESGEISNGRQVWYDVLRTFIVNDSNDTLKYWGNNCHLKKFFSVTENNYMQFVEGNCRGSEIEVLSIPPHRSKLVPLKLLVKKRPQSDLTFNVSFRLYRHLKSNHFENDTKGRRPEILTDEITLRYNKDGGEYYGPSDFEQEEQKVKLNLPTTELHLLTAEERKLYTITVNQNKITMITAPGRPYTERKIFRVPVSVRNDGDDTLKYYSMTCSWLEFYHTDNKYFELMLPNCDLNSPFEIEVPPHSVHTDIVPIIPVKNAPPDIKSLKIGLSINTKAFFNDDYDDELQRYNIVWSNEIQIGK